VLRGGGGGGGGGGERVLVASPVGGASASASASGATRTLLAASAVATDHDSWLASSGASSFYGLGLQRVGFYGLALDRFGEEEEEETPTGTTAAAPANPFPRVSFTIRFSNLNHASLASNVAGLYKLELYEVQI
jgi:hypothetical protein